MTFGGGFTVDVLPDDGSEPATPDSAAGRTPRLAVDVAAAGLGPQGGPLSARAYAPGGQPVEHARWFVVYDPPGQPAPDGPVLARFGSLGAPRTSRTITESGGWAKASAAMTASPSGEADLTAFVGSRAAAALPGTSAAPARLSSSTSAIRRGAARGGTRMPNASPIRGGAAAAIIRQRAGTAVAHASSVPATEGGFTNLDACADATACNADATGPTGSVLVVAEVAGRLLSAAGRFGANAGGSGLPGVTCTPARVVRGTTVTCAVVGIARVKDWTFTPDDAALPQVVRSEADGGASETQWEGPLVTSGTVSVSGWAKTADYQGPSSTSRAIASTRVAATSRDWSAKVVPHTLAESSPGGLPPVPSRDSDLGVTSFVPKVRPTYQLITRGPNAEYLYFTDVPVTVNITVSINTTALSAGSDFWRMQPERRRRGTDGVLYCSRSEVTSALPLVRAHEGFSRNDAYSHVQTYMSAFEQAARARYEGLIGRSDIVDAQGVAEEISSTAGVTSNVITHAPALNPFQASCAFNYDPYQSYAP